MRCWIRHLLTKTFTVPGILKVSTILNGLADALFPPKCLKCGRFITADGMLPLNNTLYHFAKYFCDDCLKRQECFHATPDSLCLSPHSQIHVQAASTYDGIVKESIHLLKYSGKTGLADPLGLLLFHTFARYYDNKPVDIIVPIPLYRWRMFKRGFNQSFLLVRNFRNYWLQWKGTYPSWQIAPDILFRQRNTKSQTGFNREERKENIRGAFAVRKKDAVNGRLDGRHIVLVDDVHTTGATTTEAGNTMLEAGAASVGVIVVAQA